MQALTLEGLKLLLELFITGVGSMARDPIPEKIPPVNLENDPARDEACAQLVACGFVIVCDNPHPDTRQTCPTIAYLTDLGVTWCAWFLLRGHFRGLALGSVSLADAVETLLAETIQARSSG